MNTYGQAAGGAKLYTFRSLNKTQDKAVYQDASGSLLWTNPIIFDENGSQGPFYWEVDSENPEELYYLVAKDSAGNLLWTIDNFSPPGSGGGSNVTTYVNLNNLIINNVFIDHADNTASPIAQTNTWLAPSNHHGFTPDQVPVVSTYGAVGPDIRFVKNNTTATDQITFEPFTPGSDPLDGDITPDIFCRYACINTPTGETYKSFQFPINQKVNNLDSQTVTFTLWASVETTGVDINVYVRQFFGSAKSSGTPSVDARSAPVTALSLTTTWTKFTRTIVVPSISGKTLGDCDDDALYIQIDMPLNSAANVRFTKPCLFVGNLNPQSEFQSYDAIDSIAQSPRTGDIVATYFNRLPKGGWVPMDNRSIGSANSLATARANNDSFFLYKTLWDAVSDTYAPVTGGRGATAQADFVADKPLILTNVLGRVLAGQNANFSTGLTFTVNTGVSTTNLTVSSSATLPTGTPILLQNTGGAVPTGLTVNTIYYVINTSSTTVALALSEDLAQSATAITLSSNGTGTNTLAPVLGATFGEGVHQLTIAEMPSHNHPGSTVGIRSVNFTSGGPDAVLESGGSTAVTIGSQGGGVAHNTVQPTIFSNIFIKL